MPDGVSDDGARIWLSALFGLQPAPTAYYIALCTDEPGSGMDGDIIADIEPSAAAGYARQQYGTGADRWGVNGQYIANTDEIAYPAPTDDWGYITHFALCSDATSGLVYAWGAFLNPQSVDADTGVYVPVGSLILGLTSLQQSIAA